MIFEKISLSIVLFFYFEVIDAHHSISVNISSGQINGIRKTVDGSDVNVFLGIPYAQPPIGELRFKKPLPLNHQLDAYDATHWPKPCVQQPMVIDSFLNKNFNEDCLYLNIWSPIDMDIKRGKSVDLKPVMFWIHGGGLSFGSSSQFLFNGDILATKGDVVVVTINYRLNVFGFFYTGTDDAPGNVCLWDQALALEWVDDNIKYFGGDPNQITLFGDSAGGWSISLHLLSPITEKMYKNAILMSGAVVSSELIDDPMVSKTKWLNGAKLIGCDNEVTGNIIKCLRDMDANRLFEITKLKAVNEGKFFTILPVIDGEFVTQSPKKSLDSGQFKSGANVLIGTTEDEGSFMLNTLVDRIKYDKVSPKNLTYAEAYQELVNIITSDYLRLPTNGEVARFYFTEMSSLTEDYDLLRRTIGIAIGDYYLGCPTIHFAKALLKNDRKLFSSNVYQYHYNDKIAVKFLCGAWMGACHCDDLFPVFGIPFQNRDNSLDAERDESLQMIEFFAHFAKHGYPSPQYGKDWPKYYTIDDNVIAPYFDMKNKKFRNGLKHVECDILFKSYLAQ